MYDFQIAFGNKTLKKIRNKTPNKFIKVKLKFRIYKLFVSFNAINQCMSLSFDFIWTI